MELLLKTYPDQASRIGVTYKYEYLARQAYEELIRKHRKESFILQLEPVKGKINLTLCSEQSGKKIVYKDLDLKPDLLQGLEQLAWPDPDLVFVHLYKEANRLLIARPFRQPEFFRISSYELTGYGTFT
jgi:hypothetical protein